ncbi:MAG: ribosome maturation factor RimP [Clostridia bacterium]|nr:ribosome maturation factor RimP [Clostridia bacterium]
MTQKEAVRRVTQLVLPLCGEAGVSLWDVTFEKEGRQHVLTVYIDKEPAVDISDCERVSRALDPLLDAPEFDSLPPYVLTVSSAGLERPLNREEHLQWALGKEIVLRFYRPLNGARELTGTLRSFSEQELLLQTEAGETAVPRAAVAQARLSFTF